MNKGHEILGRRPKGRRGSTHQCVEILGPRDFARVKVPFPIANGTELLGAGKAPLARCFPVKATAQCFGDNNPNASDHDKQKKIPCGTKPGT
jgi:hypothetical protein